MKYVIYREVTGEYKDKPARLYYAGETKWFGFKKYAYEFEDYTEIINYFINNDKYTLYLEEV